MSSRGPLLTDAELMIPAVAKILAHFAARLTKLREENDNYDSDQSTRGRIAEIKDFKKAIKPKLHNDCSERKSAM